MNTKKHFYSLFVSVVYSSALLFSLSLFIPCFIDALLNNRTINIIGSSIFLTLTLFATALFVVFDGWASWQVIDDVIVIKKIFRKTKSINFSEVTIINKCYRFYHGLLGGSMVKCYQIICGNIKTVIPASKELAIVVKKIVENYKIEVLCDYKKTDEDDDW